MLAENHHTPWNGLDRDRYMAFSNFLVTGQYRTKFHYSPDISAAALL